MSFQLFDLFLFSVSTFVTLRAIELMNRVNECWDEKSVKCEQCKVQSLHSIISCLLQQQYLKALLEATEKSLMANVVEVWNNDTNTSYYEPVAQVNRSSWMSEVRTYTLLYHKKLHNYTRHEWDGSVDLDDRNVTGKWTFAGALLYSITAITTIGERLLDFLCCIHNITWILGHSLGWRSLKMSSIWFSSKGV